MSKHKTLTPDINKAIRTIRDIRSDYDYVTMLCVSRKINPDDAYVQHRRIAAYLSRMSRAEQLLRRAHAELVKEGGNSELPDHQFRLLKITGGINILLDKITLDALFCNRALDEMRVRPNYRLARKLYRRIQNHFKL